MTGKKKDINNLEDIKLMVNGFYEKVKKDEILSPVFNDIAEVDWESHLPKMYAFWNKVLFGQGDYKGNPFVKHVPLPVKPKHFSRWVDLFSKNLDTLFAGKMAESTKLRARSIAHIFESKLCNQN